jgi:hypothetical protein
VTFDALIDAAARASPLVPRWASTAAAAASAAVLSTFASQVRDATPWDPTPPRGPTPQNANRTPPHKTHAAPPLTPHGASTIASQPGDAILSEVSRGGGKEARGIGAAASSLGAAGLARGLPARLVQVGIIVTVQLILYDALKQAFGVP